MAIDKWANSSAAGGINAPVRKTIDIDAEKHATTALTIVPRGIVCDAAGDIVLRFPGDSADRTLTLLAGIIYPYSPSHVRATGTTATGLIGLV